MFFCALRKLFRVRHASVRCRDLSQVYFEFILNLARISPPRLVLGKKSSLVNFKLFYKSGTSKIKAIIRRRFRSSKSACL